MKNRYFIRFANCVLTKGLKRSSIADLQNHKVQLIPNILYQILSDNLVIDIEKVYADYAKNEEDKSIINDYFSFLVEKRFGFFSSENLQGLFPQLNQEFDFPYRLSNVIIDLSEENKNYMEKAINELLLIHCHSIQFRVFKTFLELHTRGPG